MQSVMIESRPKSFVRVGNVVFERERFISADYKPFDPVSHSRSSLCIELDRAGEGLSFEFVGELADREWQKICGWAGDA